MDRIGGHDLDCLAGHNRYEKVRQNTYSVDEALVCVCFLQIRDLNQGTFGFVQLAWDKRCTPPQQVAVKFMERGDKINKYVESEILNHRMLLHPHIIQFREVRSNTGKV